ncbi:MAG: ATP-binding protein [Acidimicrobiales bacterium]
MALSTMAAVVGLAAASYLLVRSEMRSRAADSALEQTRANLQVVDARVRRATVEEVAAANLELERLGRFEIVTRVHGAVLQTDLGIGLADVPPALLRPGPAPTAVRAGLDGVDHVVVGAAAAADPGLEYWFFYSLDPVERDLSTVRNTLAAVTLVVSAAAALLALMSATALLAPVDRTAQAARRLAKGALEVRVAEDRGREFADLTGAFNEMAGALQGSITRLQEMEAAQRRFVADVSHELRTPLTALSTAADLLEPGIPALPEPSRRAGELLLMEVRRLRGLVEDLMAISRFDAGAEALTVEPVDVVAAVHAALARRRLGVGIRVDSDVAAAIVETDPRRLDSIVGNLAVNAVLHGAAPITVTIASTEDGVAVEVSDSGPGIAAQEASMVFERFYKADASRTRRRATGRGAGAGPVVTTGSGLGLAIARENARMLGGELAVRQPGRPGGRFVLTLPPAPPAAASRAGSPGAER